MWLGQQRRKNYRRRTTAKRGFRWLGRLAFGIKLAVGITAVAAMTAGFILIHDILTQCDYFKAQTLAIEGMQRLTSAQVARQAQVHAGVNILAVNLSLARKRLLAHPWVADAEVIREIPNGLRIRLKEHRPLAVIDIGEKFLINQHGEIFKEWNPSDPQQLPVISGLDVSDLKLYAVPLPPPHPGEAGSTIPFNAVMQVLQLGDQPGSALPNRVIKYIRVDRQMGLSLYAFDQLKMINLGYNDYAGKYQMLKSLFAYLMHQNHISDFDRLDLNNMNRIVLNPKAPESGPKDS